MQNNNYFNCTISLMETPISSSGTSPTFFTACCNSQYLITEINRIRVIILIQSKRQENYLQIIVTELRKIVISFQETKTHICSWAPQNRTGSGPLTTHKLPAIWHCISPGGWGRGEEEEMKGLAGLCKLFNELWYSHKCFRNSI